MQPKWTHDCEQCRFIGAMYSGRDLFDWYICGNTVVARYGNDGPEYWSSPRDVVEDDKHLNISDSSGFRRIYGMNVLARFMLSQKR